MKQYSWKKFTPICSLGRFYDALETQLWWTSKKSIAKLFDSWLCSQIMHNMMTIFWDNIFPKLESFEEKQTIHSTYWCSSKGAQNWNTILDFHASFVCKNSCCMDSNLHSNLHLLSEFYHIAHLIGLTSLRSFDRVKENYR